MYRDVAHVQMSSHASLGFEMKSFHAGTSRIQLFPLSLLPQESSVISKYSNESRKSPQGTIHDPSKYSSPEFTN
jgi:hypothetical protein